MNKKLYVISTVLALVMGLTQALPAYAETGAKKENKEFRKEKERTSVKAAKGMPSLEVHLTADGKALVRGAKVTAVSTSTITATTGWGSSTILWNVATDSETKFIERSSGKSAIADIKVGDTISFQGKLDTSIAAPLTVRASAVKNWSREAAAKTTLQGTAKTALASTTLPSSFVLSSGNTDYRVNITSGTSILDVFWLNTPVTSIKAGDTVRVYGAVNADATVDATVVRDVSVR